MKRQFLAIVQSPTGDRPIIALILLLFGVFILALQDVTVKMIAHETSFWQFKHCVRLEMDYFWQVWHGLVADLAFLCQKAGALYISGHRC